MNEQLSFSLSGSEPAAGDSSIEDKVRRAHDEYKMFTKTKTSSYVALLHEVLEVAIRSRALPQFTCTTHPLDAALTHTIRTTLDAFRKEYPEKAHDDFSLIQYVKCDAFFVQRILRHSSKLTHTHFEKHKEARIHQQRDVRDQWHQGELPIEKPLQYFQGPSVRHKDELTDRRLLNTPTFMPPKRTAYAIAKERREVTREKVVQMLNRAEERTGEAPGMFSFMPELCSMMNKKHLRRK